MKILSMYLPGFHRNETNDKAWGKGFTEWNNVKKAQKLFKNHQPATPLNGNYYELTDPNVFKWQSDLAKKYSVDGFVFYHYWFGNGKMELYKPVEIYRKELKDKTDYCFCWANHSWVKNWHDADSRCIVEQQYFDEKDWISHINYFIEYFKDENYIKIDGRPLLYMYDMSSCDCFDEMLKVWNRELNNKGFKDLYVCELISSKNRKQNSEMSDAVVEFEPLYTNYFDVSKFNLIKRLFCKLTKRTDFQNYDKLWKKIIKRTRVYGSKHIQKGCFVNWDNSPRRGRNSTIVKGGTPEKFYNNLKKLIEHKRENCDNDFIVINAWNEWGEGAVLEPTEKDKYAYLEAIKRIKDEYAAK